MLSTRGAISTHAMLGEVTDTQPPSLKKVLLMSEVQKTWSAMCRVLRAQLLQGHNIVLPHRCCGFYFKSHAIIRDGDTKYHARTPYFGFHDSFVTKFSLDTAMPRVDTGDEMMKLPLDYVAQEAGLPIDFVSTLLHEIVLFLGESIFRGRLHQLDFGICSVLVKREKAIVTFDEQFMDDVYAIDSRKWPSAIKEAGASVVKRPVSSATSRPASSRRSNSAAGVRPPSAQSRTSSAARPPSARPVETPRAAFVSSASAGKLFADLSKIKPRAAPTPKTSARGRQPLRGIQQGKAGQQKPEAEERPAQILGELAEGEEESIYSVLSPSRHHDPMSQPLRREEPRTAYRQQQQHHQEEDDDDADNYYDERQVRPPAPMNAADLMVTQAAPQRQQTPQQRQPTPQQRPASRQQGESVYETYQQLQRDEEDDYESLRYGYTDMPRVPEQQLQAQEARAEQYRPPSTKSNQSNGLGEDKHVHFISPQSSVQQQRPASSTSTSNFYFGETAEQRPTSRKKQLAPIANLDRVRSLLKDNSAAY